MDSPVSASVQRALREALGDQVWFDAVTRGIYATDASNHQMMPLAVAAPRDEEELARAVRAAAENGVSLLPRGGGTSLAGQTVGASLVLDLSKHMNRLLEVDPGGGWARVQPGIVRDELNAALADRRLCFAPDPATSDRACVGGMIGNNSSGVRSIVYGKTVDHVLETRVLLADGTEMALAEMGPEAWRAREAAGGREGGIHREFRRVVEANREEIARRYPKVMRRVGGYNLDEFLGERWNLSRLMTGSEGTLALTLEAKVRLVPLPAATALCVVHFRDLLEAVRAVPALLEFGPSAVELMDGLVIALARTNPVTAALCDFFVEEPAAVQVVEFFGATPEEAGEKARCLAADLRERGIGYAHPLRLDAAGQARVAAVRKSGLGLMLSRRDERKPVHFLEDACVPVEHLGDYIAAVMEICRRHGCESTFYAHASVGVIHSQPMLDLKRQDDIDRMKAIAEECFELVLRYGGSWSGEHGDGLVRSPFNERFFGPRVYGALKEVKRLFDPRGLMNPGKIVDAEPMDRNLRYGTGYRPGAVSGWFHYRADGGFAPAVEMCMGVGACRRTLSGVMCPSYRATRDEEHSTRGRANALRMAMTGQLGEEGMTGRRLFEALDLCLSCKACKAECPANVDMARLKSDFLQNYRDRHGATRRDRMIGGSPETAARLAGSWAPLVNAAMRGGAGRLALELAAGFDRRRRLPGFAREPFSAWWRRRGGNGAGGLAREDSRAVAGTVALFADTYLNYHEPGIGVAAVELLESCGYRVELVEAGCCQRPRISHGFLREAREEGTRTLERLDAWVARGVPILVCEPSCASALADDLPDLVEDAALGARVGRAVRMVDAFLAGEVEAGRLRRRFRAAGPAAGGAGVLVHGHCHQKALFGTKSMTSLLSRAPGVAASEIDAGCCGMAGSFGYEREHYDLSRRIAEDRLLPALRAAPAGAAVVACGMSCRHQIRDLARRDAVHWVECLRAEPPAGGGA